MYTIRTKNIVIKSFIMNVRLLSYLKSIFIRTLLFLMLFIPYKTLNCQNASNNYPNALNLVFSSSSFIHVNEMDAMASLSIYINKYKTGWEEESGQIVDAKIITISETNTIESILDTGVPSLFQITSIDYIENERIMNTRPYAIGVSVPGGLEEFALLVRKESNIESISDLKNKNVVITGGMSGLLAEMWLETNLLENFQQMSTQYFNKIDFVESSSKAMINLFFKNYDACIVNTYSFEILSEMNPQMREQIVAIDISEGLLPTVTVLVNSDDKTFNDYVTDYSLNLPNETHSKQMLALFRINEIILYEDKYLDNVRKLIKKYKSLSRKYLSKK